MTAEEYGPVVSHTDGQWDVQPAPTPRTPQQIAAIWGRTATELPDDGELARAAAWLQAAWERESTADRAAYLEQLSASARTHSARKFFHDLARKVREHGDLPKTTAQLAAALLRPDDTSLPRDVSQIEHEIAEVARDRPCCPNHRLLCEVSDYIEDLCCDRCPDLPGNRRPL